MKKIGLLLGGLCIPLAFSGLGALLLKFSAAEKARTADFLETDAVIESIALVGADSHEVTVSYLADGQPYIAELNQYSSSYYVGKPLSILYNPERPDEIIGAGRWGEKLLFLLGSVIIGAGAASAIVLAAVWLKEQKKTGTVPAAPQTPYTPPVRVSAIPQPVQQLPPAPLQPVQIPQPYVPQPEPWPEASSQARIVSSYSEENAFGTQQSGEN